MKIKIIFCIVRRYVCKGIFYIYILDGDIIFILLIAEVFKVDD